MAAGQKTAAVICRASSFTKSSWGNQGSGTTEIANPNASILLGDIREEWFMDPTQMIYQRLIETACCRKVISYVVIADHLKNNSVESVEFPWLARILNEIACQENAAGRPLLSAVVVLPEIGYPRREFFMLARELGLNRFEDDRSFYGYELKRVHDYWQAHTHATQTTPYMIANGQEVRIAVA
jgi:hypothetical protein